MTKPCSDKKEMINSDWRVGTGITYTSHLSIYKCMIVRNICNEYLFT